MGQRFLVSAEVLRKIIAASKLSPEDTVLEIGAGFGTLTIELARRAKRVIAVEKDPRLIPALEKNLRDRNISNVTIVAGDILKLFPDKLPLPKTYRVIANIPYYLTSRLIRVLLESDRHPADIFLTVQKEVAERITAAPPRMNLLALAVQAYAEPKILFTVPPSAFSPQPQVDSALIRITNIGKQFFIRQWLDERMLFAILRAAFRGKRKTLENSLSQNLKLPKPLVSRILVAQGLPGKRPEMLSLAEWSRLIRALAAEIK
ncbi:MAG: ribosomal RNA small subunit methyltransferase A [Candidatus Sungbacteria bacterium]|uniref:Ribosomal RNA small subunit methyltransferase A n=1 Tax=Candidatus Sungiibacteriota bacterium TaxID=2750080 RepID=A0A932YX91_9BACT|nr:ribosomal RNA small subunit methyltransferase A [Candidatus Sungbacteria bacterium]